MTLKNLILASILSTTALAASATDTNKDYYVQFNAGIAHGQKPKGDFASGDLSNSAVYGFAVGYKFDEHFRADWSLDYRPGFKNSYNTSQSVNSISYNKTSNIKVKSLVSMVNFYYDVATIEKFTPYATFGLGLAQNKTNNHTYTTNSSENDPASTLAYSKGTRTNFAWKIGLGSKYEINSDFDLDLRYQYADLGKFTTGKSFSLDGEPYESCAAKTGSIKSHEVLLGIAYKF